MPEKEEVNESEEEEEEQSQLVSVQGFRHLVTQLIFIFFLTFISQLMLMTVKNSHQR
jgi:hypothetical protein